MYISSVKVTGLTVLQAVGTHLKTAVFIIPQNSTRLDSRPFLVISVSTGKYGSRAVFPNLWATGQWEAMTVIPRNPKKCLLYKVHLSFYSKTNQMHQCLEFILF